MTELAFTKSFLSLLDSRPIRVRADHVFDPQQVGLRVPVCRRLSFYLSLHRRCVEKGGRRGRYHIHCLSDTPANYLDAFCTVHSPTPTT